MDSILNSIKKLLGITEDFTAFDEDIIMHINSALATLTQIGVGPPNGFSISDAYATWDEFIDDDLRFESVKSYVYLKVRLLFDPPASSVTVESMKQMISEYEWRLNVAAESKNTADSEVNQNG